MKPDEACRLFGSATKPFSLAARADDSWVLASDHLGMEPLFYARSTSGPWVAATTVEEVLQTMPAADVRFDEASVVGHIATPNPPRPGSTFFAGVHTVAPGTMVRLTPEGPEKTHYWDPATIRFDRAMTLADAAAELRRLLFEVVPDYVSGAHIAATLSSGMDSTSVLAALVESGADVLAVTFTSADIPEADETAWARLTASRLGVPLTEVPIAADSLLTEAAIVTRRSTPLFNVYDELWRATSQKVAEGRRGGSSDAVHRVQRRPPLRWLGIAGRRLPPRATADSHRPAPFS